MFIFLMVPKNAWTAPATLLGYPRPCSHVVDEDSVAGAVRFVKPLALLFLIFFVVGAIRLENQLGFHARRLVEVIAFAPVHGLGQCSIGVRV